MKIWVMKDHVKSARNAAALIAHQMFQTVVTVLTVRSAFEVNDSDQVKMVLPVNTRKTDFWFYNKGVMLMDEGSKNVECLCEACKSSKDGSCKNCETCVAQSNRKYVCAKCKTDCNKVNVVP